MVAAALVAAAVVLWAPNAIRSLDGERGLLRLKLRNRVRANRPTTVQQAALAGFGIAPLMALICHDALASGALVEVLQGALPRTAPTLAPGSMS